MSNSSLVTYKNLTEDCNKPRKNKIDTITIHCYVGQVTAKQGSDYFKTSDRQVSSNYVVGYDGSIGLSVEECNRAWTSGGKDKYGNVIYVNGISGADNDHRAVTIEVACDEKPPYAVTDKAYSALINLVADICKRNGIKKLIWKNDKSLVGQPDKQNMTVHRWFANTDCPGDYLMSHMSDIANKVNAKLTPKRTNKFTYDAVVDKHRQTGEVKFDMLAGDENEVLKADIIFKEPFNKTPRIFTSVNSSGFNSDSGFCNVSKTGATIIFKRSDVVDTSVNWEAVGE